MKFFVATIFIYAFTLNAIQESAMDTGFVVINPGPIYRPGPMDSIFDSEHQMEAPYFRSSRNSSVTMMPVSLLTVDATFFETTRAEPERRLGSLADMLVAQYALKDEEYPEDERVSGMDRAQVEALGVRLLERFLTARSFSIEEIIGENDILGELAQEIATHILHEVGYRPQDIATLRLISQRREVAPVTYAELAQLADADEQANESTFRWILNRIIAWIWRS